MTIPLAPVLGIIAMPHLRSTIDYALRGDFKNAMENAGYIIGITPSGFDANWLVQNMTPPVVGLLVHKFIGGAPLNLNRTLARAKVPLIRI